MSTDLTDGSTLAQYLILAKNSKGKACAQLIQQVLGAPNVYVFGELLDLPNVQQVLYSNWNPFVNLFVVAKRNR
jgi:COP9 signalosome complex subunit 7